jgi:SSS family solute:Na+ symporter
MSLIVKVGALLVILFIPTKFAIDFQLLGGVWMIQCFPAIIFGLFTRWFSGWALLIGWAVGMFLGTYLSWGPTAWVPTYKVFELFAAYNGLTSVCVNILVSAVLSLALRSKAPDETVAADYEASRSALA